MDISGRGRLREASIHAVKILADGTRVDLGVVSYYHRNTFKRLWWWLARKFKERT